MSQEGGPRKPLTEAELYRLVGDALNEDNQELAEWYQSIIDDRNNPELVPEPETVGASSTPKSTSKLGVSAFAAACGRPSKTFLTK